MAERYFSNHFLHLTFVFAADPVFAVHIAEVLNRVDEIQEQLQSYVRHQQVQYVKHFSFIRLH